MTNLEKFENVAKIRRFVPKAVSRRVARQILVTQKHSPTILFGTGIVLMGATVVTACRATLKVEEVLNETTKQVNMAKEVAGLGREDYTEKDLRKDLAIVYIRGSVKLAKLYGPAFVMGVTSIASLAGAHNILSKRNIGLTAAYAALEKGFDEYRDRVREEFGDEKERELRYSAEERTIVEEGKNGPEKKQIKHYGSSGASIYARLFEDTNRNWNKLPEYNLIFLRSVQNWANDRLETKGHVFLNEIYDELGLERTSAGAVVGWLWRQGGDDFIDFGIWGEKDLDKFHDFMVGRENAILLDFNVDGKIYDKI